VVGISKRPQLIAGHQSGTYREPPVGFTDWDATFRVVGVLLRPHCQWSQDKGWTREGDERLDVHWTLHVFFPRSGVQICCIATGERERSNHSLVLVHWLFMATAVWNFGFTSAHPYLHPNPPRHGSDLLFDGSLDHYGYCPFCALSIHCCEKGPPSPLCTHQATSGSKVCELVDWKSWKTHLGARFTGRSIRVDWKIRSSLQVLWYV
jgi:hypothetical protein